MKIVKINPITVNRAWQGRRFKTPLYTFFIDKIALLFTRHKQPKLNTSKPLFAHYIFGTNAAKLSDTDNFVKPFQDRLFDWLRKADTTVNDKQITLFIAEKTKTKKGEEFIAFHLDTQDNLIDYLKQLIKRLEKES